MAELGNRLPPAGPIEDAPLPGAPGTVGTPVKVQSNVFGLVLTAALDNVRRYDVTMVCSERDDIEDFDDPEIKPIFLTKKSGNDAYATERKSKAFAVMDLLMKKHPDVFADRSAYYDGQSILFSSKPLVIKEGGGRQFRFLHKPDGAEKIEGVRLVEVVIRELTGLPLDFSTYKMQDNSSPVVSNDHSLCQYFQIYFMQHVLKNRDLFLCFEKGKVFFKNAATFNLQEEARQLPEGKELKPGVRMSVQLVEGPKGRDRANFAVAIDAKKSAFHSKMSLPEKAMAILPRFTFQERCNPAYLDKLNTVLKGVMIETTHTKKPKAYKIIGIRMDSNYELTLPDGKMSVREYYKTKYNIVLNAPLAPLVVVQAKKETFFPMEVCNVIENQRVTIPQQTAEQMSKTTKECAVLPFRRQRIVVQGIQKMGLLDKDRSDDGGVRFIEAPLTIDARCLPMPVSANYHNGHQFRIDPSTGKWRTERNMRYLQNGHVVPWGFVSIDCRNHKLMEDGMLHIIQGAKSKGLMMGNPQMSLGIQQNELEKAFEQAKKQGLEFIFLVTDDQTIIQDKIKVLERRYEIATQNIKSKTAGELPSGRKATTIENIINKFNMKLGGLNYTLKINGHTLLDTADVLVLGIGAVAPPSGISLDSGDNVKMPIIVGYSANTTEHPGAFVGDFHVAASEHNDSQLIGHLVVEQALNEWLTMGKLTKGSRPLPKQLIIYRGGVPEGEFDKLRTHELPMIRKTMRMVAGSSQDEIKLTYVIVSKDHCVRIYKSNAHDCPFDQNVTPGTIVDTGLTHPKFRQFYLNSHIALQGSAMTPRYTALVDESGWSTDDFQRLTYNLCFMHQIVNMPTSLPSPLYIANKYADRGRRMVMQYAKDFFGRGNGAGFDLGQVETELRYKHSKFADRRINA
ncbi:unnamed protein product, partial [Mesorhabditis spiculigera]